MESRMLKFSLWKEKDFLAYLWGTGIFPEEELILEEDDGEEVSVQEKTRPVSEQRGIVTLYDMKTGIEESKMIVEEEGIFPYVVLRTGLTENRRPYCHKDCEHVLMDWLHREG